MSETVRQSDCPDPHDLGPAIHLSAVAQHVGQQATAAQRDAMRATLSIERTRGFLDWANRRGCQERNLADAEKTMALQEMQWASTITAEVQAEIRKELPGIIMKGLRFRVLLGLMRIFDPERHEEGFRAFAEKYVRGAVNKSLEAERCIVTAEPTAADLESYLEGAPA